MRFSDILIANLKTTTECDQAIESIRDDYRNVVGGFKSWNSGSESRLLAGAENKIRAIEIKYDKLFKLNCKRQYDAYIEKGNDFVTFDFYFDECLFA